MVLWLRFECSLWYVLSMIPLYILYINIYSIYSGIIDVYIYSMHIPGYRKYVGRCLLGNIASSAKRSLVVSYVDEDWIVWRLWRHRCMKFLMIWFQPASQITNSIDFSNVKDLNAFKSLKIKWSKFKCVIFCQNVENMKSFKSESLKLELYSRCSGYWLVLVLIES